MPRLILTTDDIGAGSLSAAGIADIVLPFRIRFVWGPLPSDAKFAAFAAARSRKRGSAGSHWLDFVRRLHLKPITGKAHGLIDFCERCETIELWADPEPNAQLTRYYGANATSSLSWRHHVSHPGRRFTAS